MAGAWRPSGLILQALVFGSTTDGFYQSLRIKSKMLLTCMLLLIFHCFSSLCRRVCGDDSLLRPQQADGLLHHPDLHPLHPDRGPLLGLLLDQERRHAGEDHPRYAASHTPGPHQCPNLVTSSNVECSICATGFPPFSQISTSHINISFYPIVLFFLCVG